MTITIKENEITVDLSFWEKLWSLHGNFQIPKSNIVSISKGGPHSSWFDLRIPGTFLPGVIKAGTFYTRRGREFWYVRYGSPRIYSIELVNMSFKRLVLGTSQQFL